MNFTVFSFSSSLWLGNDVMSSKGCDSHRIKACARFTSICTSKWLIQKLHNELEWRGNSRTVLKFYSASPLMQAIFLLQIPFSVSRVVSQFLRSVFPFTSYFVSPFFPWTFSATLGPSAPCPTSVSLCPSLQSPHFLQSHRPWPVPVFCWPSVSVTHKPSNLLLIGTSSRILICLFLSVDLFLLIPTSSRFQQHAPCLRSFLSSRHSFCRRWKRSNRIPVLQESGRPQADCLRGRSSRGWMRTSSMRRGRKTLHWCKLTAS